MAENIDLIRQENERLRAALAMSDRPCAYCTLPADKWGECQHGFPGCARSDDATGCPHLGAALDVEHLRSRIAELEARLEIDHHFEYIDGEMVRVEIAHEERQIGDCDGIGCRDATIALQDDVIDRASSRIAVLETALEPFARQYDDVVFDGMPGELLEEYKDFCFEPLTVASLRHAHSVLSEGKSDSKPILDAKGGARTGEGELEATSGDHDANEAS